MHVTSDLVIVGGGIGSLVAAITAADAGAEVTLLRPAQGLGAGFVSLSHQNRLLDVGCRRFDFTQDTHTAPLEGFSLGVRTRPYAEHARVFIEKTLGLELVATVPPQLSYDGKLAPDFATSLDLTSLANLLPKADIARIISETDIILANDPPSPFTLGHRSWPDLSAASLNQASLVNHGSTFHTRFIEPFANKLYAAGWKDMPADLIAKIWTPLFFPRTINQGARQVVERDRPAVTYFYPAEGHFGAFVNRLMTKVDEHENIHQLPYTRLVSLRPDDGGFLASQTDGPSLRWSCPFSLGVSVENYLGLAGINAKIETLSLAILWVEIDEDDLLSDIDTVMVFDPTTSIYRISRAGDGALPGHCILALEMTGGDNACDAARAMADLARLGIAREGAAHKILHTKNDLKIIAPSHGNREQLRQARGNLARAGVQPTLFGTLNDLKSDMLNDQILQGLTFGKNR